VAGSLTAVETSEAHDVVASFVEEVVVRPAAKREKCIHEAAADGDPDALDAILDEIYAISGLRKARVLPRNQD
jgi:hypothetical protein